MINQITLIVLDSVGIGDAPDAAQYGDVGSNTIGNIAKAVNLSLPNMAQLGLGHLGEFRNIPKVVQPQGAFGRLTEVSAGKDTTTGHWELAGVSLKQPFPLFPQGFPQSFLTDLEQKIGRGILGNYSASGTAIVDQLGAEHLATGKIILYTSGDSVCQIAAHEELIPLKELYEICEMARGLLKDDLTVGRVIARPFVGPVGAFKRTEHRKDFSLVPPRETILDKVKQSGLLSAGIGKIEDIFAERGLTRANHTGNNEDGITATIEMIKTRERGFIFTNLVDFDALYGHRNDVQGYADALMHFDKRLPELISALADDAILLITADHGNDPTTPSTDHSRERVPLLVVGKHVKPISIGTRDTFADVAATIAKILNVEDTGEGVEFASLMIE